MSGESYNGLTVTNALTTLLRDKLIMLDGVKKHGPMRRASVVYSADSPSDCLYFLDSGYIKIVNKASDGKEVLIAIVSPGQVFGEQALVFSGPRMVAAEVLQDGILYEIPRQVFLENLHRAIDIGSLLAFERRERDTIKRHVRGESIPDGSQNAL